MKTETTGKIKYGVWSLIGGAVIAMIIGFAWGGWSTAATTQKISEEAVLASHAAICVAQFMNEPNHEEKLKELGELSSYQRSGFIENTSLNYIVIFLPVMTLRRMSWMRSSVLAVFF